MYKYYDTFCNKHHTHTHIHNHIVEDSHQRQNCLAPLTKSLADVCKSADIYTCFTHSHISTLISIRAPAYVRLAAIGCDVNGF